MYLCVLYKICFIVYTGETKINDTYLLTYLDVIMEINTPRECYKS